MAGDLWKAGGCADLVLQNPVLGAADVSIIPLFRITSMGLCKGGEAGEAGGADRYRCLLIPNVGIGVDEGAGGDWLARRGLREDCDVALVRLDIVKVAQEEGACRVVLLHVDRLEAAGGRQIGEPRTGRAWIGGVEARNREAEMPAHQIDQPRADDGLALALNGSRRDRQGLVGGPELVIGGDGVVSAVPPVRDAEEGASICEGVVDSVGVGEHGWLAWSAVGIKIGGRIFQFRGGPSFELLRESRKRGCGPSGFRSHYLGVNSSTLYQMSYQARRPVSKACCHAELSGQYLESRNRTNDLRSITQQYICYNPPLYQLSYLETRSRLLPGGEI